MKTPKFNYALRELKRTVNQKSLFQAWQKKVNRQLRKQIVLDLCDYRDFQVTINSQINSLKKEVYDASYKPQRPVYFLMEKSRGLCRQMTLSHPRDMIILQALSSSLQNDLKVSAPTDRAFFEPGDGQFSKNKLAQPDDSYGSVASWKRFQKTIFGFTKERNYIVVTDVANFYDFINFRHLRNVIASQCKVDEVTLDFLIYILNELSWSPDFMPRSEVGLPQMELEAPRILANAMLFELDKVATDHALGDYARFMDDIDVGVDTIVAAKNVVKDIDLTLQSRQLRLNASKTKILSTKRGDASRHFCIKENYLLDRIFERFEGGLFDKKKETKRVRRLYQEWRGAPISAPMPGTSRFFEGNGEKIFKRISTAMEFLDAPLPSRDFVWIVKNRPSLRSFALSRLMHTKQPNSTLYILSDIAQSGLLIDDASYIEIAKFAVHVRIRKNNKFSREIRRLIESCRIKNGYFGLYAALLMASKFLEPFEIMAILEEGEDMLQKDFWLGRLVGGLAPSFLQDPQTSENYSIFVKEIGNQDALSVKSFHEELWRSTSAAQRHFVYITSPNPTFPRGIIHSKAMLARSIKENADMALKWKEVLRKQPALGLDAYYKIWALG